MAVMIPLLKKRALTAAIAAGKENDGREKKAKLLEVMQQGLAVGGVQYEMVKSVLDVDDNTNSEDMWELVMH